MWLKVCGNTRLVDVLLAQQLGYDAAGFIFAPSPRQVHVPQLQDWLAEIHLQKVGVFVNESLEMVQQIQAACGLDIVQLHGDETPEFCAQFSCQVLKAIRVRDAASLQKMQDYPENVKILLDTYEKGKAGGTGKTINYALLDEVQDFSRIILAGGVGPQNIQELYARYHPYGFDVNSQVEIEPGVKDHQKLKLLKNRLEEIL